jgi:leukotriene-A4 hydrolase
MVFLTPTVIKGDAAGAQVVAHELAHSWTGNLITNKTNEDFWLNEVIFFFFSYHLID